MTKSNTCHFATVLFLIPENVYGRPLKKKIKKKQKKKTGNGLAAGFLYHKIYGYFLQCINRFGINV